VYRERQALKVKLVPGFRGTPESKGYREIQVYRE